MNIPQKTALYRVATILHAAVALNYIIISIIASNFHYFFPAPDTIIFMIFIICYLGLAIINYINAKEVNGSLPESLLFNLGYISIALIILYLFGLDDMWSHHNYSDINGLGPLLLALFPTSISALILIIRIIRKIRETKQKYPLFYQ
ncbi:MAG: hypothetical protein AAB373_03885 [Patescibacteria group bacterium]